MDDRLTHQDSNGVLRDLLERFASQRGRLWHEAIKRFLVGTSTDFYMLEIGNHGNIKNLLQTFAQAGFSVSPINGLAQKGLHASAPRQCSGQRECLKMTPVRAMDFGRTKWVKHKSIASAIMHIGLMDGCVATSWEAACNLLLETQGHKEEWNRKRTLLDSSPSPIVWTFIGGNYENRLSFAVTGKPGERPPLLVGLVSEDAGLGFKGIAEANYLWDKLGRIEASPHPSDVFVFSYKTE